ncbi:MAG: TonB-dependent hemoglobin/transferrin/lactoferrin family receptor [Burkholderiaceae bacterium]
MPKRFDPRAALAGAIALACAAAASAQTAARLDAVEVIGVAYRMDRQIDAIAPTATAITRRDIEREVVTNLRELLRYEPGVAIDDAPARFGLGAIGIRGMTGNRVLMTLDGVRLPDAYRVGSFSNATRNQLDVGLLQKVETLRGPSSALYGSDALGGVVAFSTVDPEDVLGASRTAQATVDLGYASASERWQRGLLVAARGESLAGLVGIQRATAHETDNFGTNETIGTARTAPNPQRAAAESLLAKLVWPRAGGGRWRLTLDRYIAGVDTDVLSLNPQSSRTTRLEGDDLAQRERASVDADLPGVLGLARQRWLVYSQRALTRNDTVDLRTNTTSTCLSAVGTVNCLREVRFRFEQKEQGASWLGELDGGLTGRWLFGLEAARLAADEMRDGRQTNLNTGVTTNVVGTETFPTRDFPLSTTDRIGAFAQDELALAAHRLTLVPALRFDRFRMRAHADAAFLSGSAGRAPVDSTDQALSPRLGLLYRAAPSTTFSAQWASGFRAPPASDINIGLSSLPSGYAVIPNPDLKAERSHGLELGVRGRYPRFEVTATAFDTRYRDLILSRAALPCPADPRCVPAATGTFQSQNVARARIRGVEASALWRVRGPWSVQAAASYAHGDDTDRNVPLNTIEPTRLVAGAFYDGNGFSAALHATHARAKARIDTRAGALFAPPAYTVVDLTASWQVHPHARVSAGLFNLFDRKYWLWSDVRDAPNPGATIDRYTQPGRNASVLLRAQLW